MPDAPPPQSSSPVAAHALLLGGAAAAVFLAGGAPQGNLGVFLLCAGVALVACPPRVRVEGRLWAAAAGLVSCAAMAFLPARWAQGTHWRQAVAAAPAVVLPGTITAAPGETAFWLAVLALSLLIGLFALSQPVRARGMFWIVLAAVAVCAVYAGLAMYAKLTGWKYPFSGGATFGFLPNRNHSATLLITGSVLAAGLMGVAFRDRRWLAGDAALLGGLVCTVALCFFSESRAGVLILCAGGALWLAGLGSRHRPARLLMVAAVAGFVAGGLFLAFRSPARDRLLDTVGIRVGGGGGGGKAAMPVPTSVPTAAGTDGGSAVAAPSAGGAPADPPSEFRVAIYRDALAMIRDQPWTGTGLGTFAAVFPQYRRASLVPFVALHPESDWLMLMAECGLPAFGCAAALVALALRRLRGLAEHPYWPLRWGCAAAAAAALLHGAVDVPAHRAALGWWVLALAGLALQRKPAESGGRTAGGGGEAVGTGARNFNAETRRTRRLAEEEEEGGGREERGRWQRKAQHAAFVLAGVGALALGGTLVRAEWFQGPSLPPFEADGMPWRLFRAYQHKDYAAGEALARRTLRAAPLRASPYYYLGILLAVSDEEGVDAQVDEMFQAERVLDPVMPDVARHQIGAWAGYDPARQTLVAMDELARIGRINQALGRGWSEDWQYYRDLVGQAATQPDVQRYLLAVARPDGRFAEVWARTANPTLVQARVDRLAADAAAVAGGGAALRPDWYLQPENAGPVRPARVGADGVPPEGWEDAAWPVRLRQCVYAGQYERAVDMVTRRYGISLEVPGRAGDQDGARRELAKAAGGGGEPASVETWRWQAALAAHDGKWKDAWLLLERYVRHTRQMEWP